VGSAGGWVGGSRWGRGDRTLWGISSAVAVQLMGLQSLFQVVMNASMAWVKSFVESNEPRRMTFRVMMPLKISIWFIQDALVGVKWNTTWPFCLSSHAFASFDTCGEALSSTTCIFWPR